MTDPMLATAGVPYVIGQVVMHALAAALPGVNLRDNPATGADLQDGARQVVFQDVSDGLREQTGNSAQRSFTFHISVLARTRNARLTAHTDYRNAKRAALAAISDFARANVGVTGFARELSTDFHAEDFDVGGAYITGVFVIDYRERQPF